MNVARGKWRSERRKHLLRRRPRRRPQGFIRDAIEACARAHVQAGGFDFDADLVERRDAARRPEWRGLRHVTDQVVTALGGEYAADAAIQGVAGRGEEGA